MHSQKPTWPPLTTWCHSVWHIFEPITLAKGPTFLLLIRIWFIVSFKVMMMMTKAYVWACKIRPEPVWCPSFAGGLVCTFSFAHWHSSTSLSFYSETVCNFKTFVEVNQAIKAWSFACSFQIFSMGDSKRSHCHRLFAVHHTQCTTNIFQSLWQIFFNGKSVIIITLNRYFSITTFSGK